MKGEDVYFSSVFSKLKFDVDALIVVTHLVPRVDDFLLTLNKFIPIAAVIPKPNSIVESVVQNIENKIQLLRYTRSKIKSAKESFLQIINTIISKKKIWNYRYRRIFFPCAL